MDRALVHETVGRFARSMSRPSRFPSFPARRRLLPPSPPPDLHHRTRSHLPRLRRRSRHLLRRAPSSSTISSIVFFPFIFPTAPQSDRFSAFVLAIAVPQILRLRPNSNNPFRPPSMRVHFPPAFPFHAGHTSFPHFSLFRHFQKPLFQPHLLLRRPPFSSASKLPAPPPPNSTPPAMSPFSQHCTNHPTSQPSSSLPPATQHRPSSLSAIHCSIPTPSAATTTACTRLHLTVYEKGAKVVRMYKRKFRFPEGHGPIFQKTCEDFFAVMRDL